MAIVERHISVPAAAAARAIAGSPSGWASLWNAVGATRSGIETGVPSTVVSVVTSETSTSTRGRRHRRSQAVEIRVERALVVGAAGVEAEGAGLEPRLRETFEVGDADGLHAADNIRLALQPPR